MVKKTKDYELLTKAVSEVFQTIEKSKDEYQFHLDKQLNAHSTSAISYWAVLRTF